MTITVSAWGMYDCHNTQRLEGRTVDAIIADWKRKNAEPTMALFPPHHKSEPVNIGRADLCPLRITKDGKEYTFGRMVMWRGDTYDPAELDAWRDACLSSPIVREWESQP